jgi:hypothetical protein
MNNAIPHEPDSSIEALDHGTREKSPNSIDPMTRAIGFPTAEVARLRELPLDDHDDREALDAVLRWIDRYVPRPLQCAEDAVVVDGIYELRIDYPDEHPRRNVDLIRVNGRVFVPETPVEVDPLDPELARDLLVEAAQRFREYERHHRAKAAGGPEGSSAFVDVADTIAKAERNADIANRIEEALIGAAITEAIKDGVIAGTRALILDDEPTEDGRFPGDPRPKATEQ